MGAGLLHAVGGPPVEGRNEGMGSHGPYGLGARCAKLPQPGGGGSGGDDACVCAVAATAAAAADDDDNDACATVRKPLAPRDDGTDCEG